MSKNKNVRTIISAICIAVIVIGIAFCISYFVWVGRGDVVHFSGAGNLGLGNDPIVETNDKGEKVQIGTNHNFLFVRDVAIDRSTFSKFTSGGMAPGLAAQAKAKAQGK